MFLRGPLTRVSLATLCLAVTSSAASAAPGKAVKEAGPAPVDMSALKSKVKLLTDGKKHYVALIPFEGSWDHVFYGDGHAFHALRVYASQSEGEISFSLTFWDPRIKRSYQADLSLKDKKYKVQCDERTTELAPVPDDEAAKLVEAATFTKPLWQYRAYALARDERGTYYFVDRRREPEGSMDFRLYVGPRGQMKRLQMTNVVSDSGGDIFSTKTGELRLILDRKESLWMKGKQRTQLTSVPVEDNAVLIYTDLGAYVGERLGTPCDDL
jgi:hypothetical protein